MSFWGLNQACSQTTPTGAAKIVWEIVRPAYKPMYKYAYKLHNLLSTQLTVAITGGAAVFKVSYKRMLQAERAEFFGVCTLTCDIMGSKNFLAD